jgi:glycosyltransferase involved in cell wall biosynthesis
MRVLVTPEWYPWPDSPVYAVFCREHARAVARADDVVVLTWRADPALRTPFRIDDAVEDGLRTLRVRFATTHIPKSPSAFQLAGCIAALARLRREGWSPDIVHAHQYTASRVALPLGALSRAPVFFTEHYSGFAQLGERERRRAKWAFERAALVCPVSDELAGHIRDVAPAANLEPVPNVVDTDVFVPSRSRDCRAMKHLITVGSLIERKGHQDLLTALADLRRRGARLTLDIIGDGPRKPYLERLANDLGVAESVRFAGSQPKRAVADAMQRADAFVLASLSENLPCVLLEAMSSGLPVVATRVGGVSEVVGPNEGILVPPGSAEALADGLERLVSNAGRYDAERLRERAVANYGYDAIARRWHGLYAAASADRRRPRLRPRAA